MDNEMVEMAVDSFGSSRSGVRNFRALGSMGVEEILMEGIDLNNPQFVSPYSPHADWKRALLIELGTRFGLHNFIETGTNKGDTVEAVRHYFHKVYSIELARPLYERSKERFSEMSNVQILYGDSGERLGEILAGSVCGGMDRRFLIWLDAHFTGEGTAGEGTGDEALVKEFRAILDWRPDSLVVVDDIHPEYKDLLSGVFRPEDGVWRSIFRHGVLILHRAGLYDIPEEF